MRGYIMGWKEIGVGKGIHGSIWCWLPRMNKKKESKTFTKIKMLSIMGRAGKFVAARDQKVKYYRWHRWYTEKLPSCPSFYFWYILLQQKLEKKLAKLLKKIERNLFPTIPRIESSNSSNLGNIPVDWSDNTLDMAVSVVDAALAPIWPS